MICDESRPFRVSEIGSQQVKQNFFWDLEMTLKINLIFLIFGNYALKFDFFNIQNFCNQIVFLLLISEYLQKFQTRTKKNQVPPKILLNKLRPIIDTPSILTNNTPTAKRYIILQ